MREKPTERVQEQQAKTWDQASDRVLSGVGSQFCMADAISRPSPIPYRLLLVGAIINHENNRGQQQHMSIYIMQILLCSFTKIIYSVNETRRDTS